MKGSRSRPPAKANSSYPQQRTHKSLAARFPSHQEVASDGCGTSETATLSRETATDSGYARSLQTELLRQLRVQDTISYTRISDNELDKNEPTLMVLLEYARVAGVHMEVIVDDRLDLPKELPSSVKYKNARTNAHLKRRNVS